MRWASALAALGVVIAAACGSDDSALDVSIATTSQPGATTSAPPEPTTTTEAPATTTSLAVDEAVLEVFEAVGSNDPDRMREAQANLTEPGSPAAGYMAFQAAQAQAGIEAGYGQNSWTTEVTAQGTIETCAESFGERECVTFADFVVSPDGRLVDFSGNGEVASGRVAVNVGQTIDVAGATVTFLGALDYTTGPGLGVALEVTAGDRALSPPGGFSSSYVSADGRQFSQSFEITITPFADLQPGATATVLLGFGGGAIGGRVTSDLCTAVDYQCTTFELDVA